MILINVNLMSLLYKKKSKPRTPAKMLRLRKHKNKNNKLKQRTPELGEEDVKTVSIYFYSFEIYKNLNARVVLE